MTSATSSTWMPRAAMSVATRVRAAPEWKASMLRVRAFWLRLPCSSTAGIPEALSCLASFLAPSLVRVKTTVRPGAAARSSRTGSRSSWCTWKTWWDIVPTGDCAESAACITGLDRTRLTRTLTPASRGYDNSDSAAQGGDLGVLAGAAEDGLARHAQGAGERRHRGFDLGRQLAGGS